MIKIDVLMRSNNIFEIQKFQSVVVFFRSQMLNEVLLQTIVTFNCSKANLFTYFLIFGCFSTNCCAKISGSVVVDANCTWSLVYHFSAIGLKIYGQWARLHFRGLQFVSVLKALQRSTSPQVERVQFWLNSVNMKQTIGGYCRKYFDYFCCHDVRICCDHTSRGTGCIIICLRYEVAKSCIVVYVVPYHL